MATKLKPIEPPAAASDVAYVHLLSELNGALREEHAAHQRLVRLAKDIERTDAARA